MVTTIAKTRSTHRTHSPHRSFGQFLNIFLAIVLIGLAALFLFPDKVFGLTLTPLLASGLLCSGLFSLWAGIAEDRNVGICINIGMGLALIMGFILLAMLHLVGEGILEPRMFYLKASDGMTFGFVGTVFLANAYVSKRSLKQ